MIEETYQYKFSCPYCGIEWETPNPQVGAYCPICLDHGNPHPLDGPEWQHM